MTSEIPTPPEALVAAIRKGAPTLSGLVADEVARAVIASDWLAGYTKRAEANNMSDLAKAFEDTYTKSVTLTAVTSDLRRLARDAAAAADVMEAHTYETSLAAVLTLTTGTLVSSFDEAWPLMDHVVGWPLMTHQRPAFVGEVAAALLEQYPALRGVDPPPNGWVTNEEDAGRWVALVGSSTNTPLTGLKVSRPVATAQDEGETNG